LFEDQAETNPRACGEPHPALEPEGRYWVYETPQIARLPRFFMLYEIDDTARRVTLHSIGFPA